MEIEDRHTTRDKRLPYPLLVSGILAFCLILSVAAHLDAQPRGRNQAGSQQIDSRRLNQILTKIEKRLTALEKQRVSHQPAAPAMHQPGPSFGQASLEARVAELEQKVSQQPAVPAANQSSSSPDLTTIEARLTALEEKVSQQPAAPLANQASSSPDLTTIEARLTALENQTGSPQQAAPATDQTGSSVGELTCTKLTVVDKNGNSVVRLMALDYTSETRPFIQLDSRNHDSGSWNTVATLGADHTGGFVRIMDNNGTGKFLD